MFWGIGNSPIIGMHVGKIQIRIDGVTFFYSPSSISITEGVLIDADGKVRAALCQAHSLFELDHDPTLRHFTFQKLSNKTNLNKLYSNSAKKWWQNFGHHYLQEEIEIFRL